MGGEGTLVQRVKAVYKCDTETQKPSIILVHEPGLETKLAVSDPVFWGFDPSLEKDSRPFEKWLEDAKKEHRKMVSVLQTEGINVLYVASLLQQRPEEIIKYLNAQFVKVEPKIGAFEREVQNAVRETYEAMLESPITGLLLGLESGKKFEQLPYEKKLDVYRELGTLMPQTNLYFTKDPVISSPAGLIKSRMAMFVRKQEPHILEIALGKENYVYRLRNGTEGGDVTMCSYVHRGNVLYGRMLLGISALSGRGIEAESEILAKKAGVEELVKLYVPDFFDPGKKYATGNVMHNDTIQMPISDQELLANIRMLEQSAVREGPKPIVNGYNWAIQNFDRVIKVPDEEQQGIYGWGSNVLPLGNRRILSSTHLKQTNKNLREAGFTVIELPSKTLTSGFGSFHCMTIYLG